MGVITATTSIKASGKYGISNEKLLMKEMIVDKGKRESYIKCN